MQEDSPSSELQLVEPQFSEPQLVEPQLSDPNGLPEGENTFEPAGPANSEPTVIRNPFVQQPIPQSRSVIENSVLANSPAPAPPSSEFPIETAVRQTAVPFSQSLPAVSTHQPVTGLPTNQPAPASQFVPTPRANQFAPAAQTTFAPNFGFNNAGSGQSGFGGSFAQPLVQAPSHVPPQSHRPAPPIRSGLAGLYPEKEFQTKRSPESQHFWDQFLTEPPEGGQYSRTEDYLSFASILANGHVFGRVDFAFIEPHFQSNNLLHSTVGQTTTVEPTNFSFDVTPRYSIGFETNAGPGVEAGYWQYNEFSDLLQFTSDGTSVASIRVRTGQPAEARELTAGPGQSLQARHHMTVNSSKFTVFKAFQAPVSRIRGSLGVRYVQIDHELFSERNDGATLFNNSNFQGGGPTFHLDYQRPIGHTPLKLLGGFGLSALFGHHDQSIFESDVLTHVETATDHSLAVIDLHLGVEFNQKFARCNSIFVRGAWESEHWLNGGSAADPDSDFGLHGFVISVGLSR